MTTSATIKDQTQPVANDRPAVWDLVMEDMAERDRVGRQRYGTPLQPHNGRDALVDAYQEALDLVVYLRQAIAERDGEVRAEPEPEPDDQQGKRARTVLQVVAMAAAGEDGCCEIRDEDGACCMTPTVVRWFEKMAEAGGPALAECEAIASGEMRIVAAGAKS